MILGSLLLLGLFKFPLWNIMLGAPQYPEPMGMDIYITGIQGVQEFDIQNIDGLNHYIGMKTIPKPEQMWEFKVFPIVIGSMIAIGLLIGILGFFGKVNAWWFLGWFGLMSILGILGMYDFNAWLTDYGTNLDPHAIMKMTNLDGTPMSYKPPLFGHQKMLNFDVDSYPALGAYLMFAGMLLTITAFFVGKIEWAKNSKTSMKTLVFPIIISFLFISCNVSPQPINYGNDLCEYCKMTIVDQHFASQLVNTNGKAYNFDAIECMINYSKENKETDYQLYLINDFENPGTLINAKTATYLVSPQISSPMSENLIGYASEKAAKNAENKYDGALYNWKSINKKITK